MTDASTTIFAPPPVRRRRLERGGDRVALERNQSNYLGNVLRLAAGDTVLVFNGRDGEWQAAIAGRKRPDILTIIAQTRPQDRLPDLTYVFAPLKHARLDYIVQKAVEMGAARLQPVLTRHTQVSRVNGERMRANVIEAAEQCGILSLADGRRSHCRWSAIWASATPSGCWCSATRPPRSAIPLQALQAGPRAADGIDVLIGPEGGFAEEERALLLRQPHIAEAVAGTADPAGRYRRGGGTGAGAGGAGRLAPAS